MTAVEFPDGLHAAVREHPYPLLFATVSGAHLYGFPSPDSDWDLRGVHLLDARVFLRIDPPDDQTFTLDRVGPDLHLDLVTHDLRKFLSLMRRPNGYVVEQVLSPLVVHTTSWHEELKDLARRCLTREHARHYLGFAQSQWRLWRQETLPRVKPLLYVYRVLLTGLRLLRTGEVQCDLNALLEDWPEFADVRDLIARKRAGGEDVRLSGADAARHRQRYEKLCEDLTRLRESSSLPSRHDASRALDEFLLRARSAP